MPASEAIVVRIIASGQPLQLGYASHLLEFSYEDVESKEDFLQVSFSDPYKKLADADQFRQGVEWKVQWGFAGKLYPARKVIVREPTVTDGMLTIKALDKGTLLKSESAWTNYNAKSIEKIIEEIAERNNVSLCYEAAVAGGIPIIKMIREGLGANRISGLYGIMNGTCNYILTTMERTGEDFAKVLKDAQELGYAEADPTLDIGGGDSGHKLVLLSALAYGCLPDFKNLSVEGIDHLEAEDIEIAAEFGCRIKLIGQATKLEDGRVLQMVAPSLVPKTSPLAHVDGVLNGIFVQGDFVGSSFVEGRGAGEGPTASAIIADVMEIAKGHCAPVFGVPSGKLEKAPTATAQDWRGEFYVRLVVEDRPGVIADIAPILRDHTISIESLIQRGRSEKEPVNIVIMTHDAKGEDIRAACAGIADLPCVLGKPLLMPVLKI